MPKLPYAKSIPLLINLLLASHLTTMAQVDPATGAVMDTAESATAFQPLGRGRYVEQMPVFKGGMDNLLRFLYHNNQFGQPASDYPSRKVYVEFMVDATGQVQQARVLKGLTLDAEALRLVNLQSRHFTPGRQNNRPVAVAYMLPISFPAVVPTGRRQLKRCASSFTSNTR